MPPRPPMSFGSLANMGNVGWLPKTSAWTPSNVCFHVGWKNWWVATVRMP